MRYLRPEQKVFDLLKNPIVSDIKKYASKIGADVFESEDSDKNPAVRIVSDGFVLDSNNGGVPRLFIRSTGGRGDCWLEYLPQEDLLVYQEDGQWKYKNFDQNSCTLHPRDSRWGRFHVVNDNGGNQDGNHNRNAKS